MYLAPLLRHLHSLYHVVFSRQIVNEAFQLFQSARRKEGEEKGDDMNSFYNTPPNVQHGTSTYIAKAILNDLLDGHVHMHAEGQCSVS